MQGYAARNQDWIKYAEFISGKTGRRGVTLWIENARENKEYFKQTGRHGPRLTYRISIKEKL